MNKEAKIYLIMQTFLTFSYSLSNIFINIFIWKINNSFVPLAIYSLVYSIMVLVTFPLCAYYSRKRTPMASARIGILFFIITYGIVLLYREQAAKHIIEIGLFLGIGSAFFAVGQHMQTLDSTEDKNRDRFLFIANFLGGTSTMLAPLLSGFIISIFKGIVGYYYVFGFSFICFIITMLISFLLKGKELPMKSHFMEVWKNPTPEWKGMFFVTIGSGVVEGTFLTFLISIMTYTILKNELTLGSFNSAASLLALITSIFLSKISRPEKRIKIYAAGAFLTSFGSVFLSIYPTVLSLIIFLVLSSVGNLLVMTILDSLTYASIEKDPYFKERRLDYVIIREIPLGIGRISGILLFLMLQKYLVNVLPISFDIFGTIYLFMVPILYKIYSHKKIAA